MWSCQVFLSHHRVGIERAGDFVATISPSGGLDDDLDGLACIGIAWVHYFDGGFTGSFWMELFECVKSSFFENSLLRAFWVIVPFGARRRYRQFSHLERRIPACLCQTLIVWRLLPRVVMPHLLWQGLGR
jgi:hypothetical protein